MQRRYRMTVLVMLLLGISMGYALLTSNLNILGVAGILNPTWDIHFENVQVKSGSVTSPTPTIDTNKTTVSYSVTLNTPGDFYEFTVDAVNAGTIDGMITEISSTLNNVEIEDNLPPALEYSITYDDGVELAENQILSAGDSETYKVKVGYKTDIDPEDLPDTEQTLNLTLTITYQQADENAEEVKHPFSLYSILKNEAEIGELATEYTGNHKDSFTQAPTHKIYHWYASDSTQGSQILDKNNVIFANFCWQMIRTTDTGGVKLLYNGIPNDGKCNNTSMDTSISEYYFNESNNSPAYVGYMYNSSKAVLSATEAAASGSLFGRGVSYNNNVYTLTTTSTTYDTTHHYSCNNTTGTCSAVRYYYFNNNYLELNDGRTIEQALSDMLNADDVNVVDSSIKSFIDTWYQNNLIGYTSQLEDTIFCNDRYILEAGGFKPNGGAKKGELRFQNWRDVYSDLSCENLTDQFCLANSKAQLTYPIALISIPELILLNHNSIRNTSKTYWTISPRQYYGSSGSENVVSAVGDFGGNYTVDKLIGVRPSVSLAPETNAVLGNGSKEKPYIIE